LHITQEAEKMLKELEEEAAAVEAAAAAGNVELPASTEPSPPGSTASVQSETF
jgi:hypothetical protein